MEFLQVVIFGCLFALLFTGFRAFSKKDWSYGSTNYDGKETQSQFLALFILIVIGFVALWYIGSNSQG